jgi:hypothetical protein
VGGNYTALRFSMQVLRVHVCQLSRTLKTLHIIGLWASLSVRVFGWAGSGASVEVEIRLMGGVCKGAKRGRG